MLDFHASTNNFQQTWRNGRQTFNKINTHKSCWQSRAAVGHRADLLMWADRRWTGRNSNYPKNPRGNKWEDCVSACEQKKCWKWRGGCCSDLRGNAVPKHMFVLHFFIQRQIWLNPYLPMTVSFKRNLSINADQRTFDRFKNVRRWSTSHQKVKTDEE